MTTARHGPEEAWQAPDIRRLFDTIPTLAWSARSDGSADFFNRRWLDYTGLSVEEARDWGWTVALHPDDLKGVVEYWRGVLAAREPGEIEARLRRLDGVYRWFLFRATPSFDDDGSVVKWLGTNTDIEDRKRAECLLAGQNRVLEMAARGDSLETILEALCRVVEQTAAGSCCSVLLFDPSGSKIQQAVAPSLPSSYNDRFAGAPVDREGGPYTEAARRKTEVIVSDVASDLRWDTSGWRTAALTHGLNACWSTPIRASNGRVLGTFAIYWREPRDPTEQDEKIIEQMTHLAAVAIERTRNEAALQQSEERFRLIVDRIPGFVCTLSAAGEVELLNRQLLEYFGRTAEDLKNWAASDAVHPDDLPRVIDAWRRSVETGQPYVLELRQRRADGVYRWFQSRALPARDTESRITGWYMLLTDIDDRKRAEEAVESNEQSLRLILDSIPGFVSTANAAGELELVSRQVLEYFGKTFEELQNWAIGDAHHPDDLARVVEVHKRAIETGEPLDVETRNLGADGVYRWFHVRGRPQRDADGRIVRWYSLVTDIDERKHAEEALRESERELRQLIDSIPGMVVVADATGQQEYANKRLLNFTNTTIEELRDFGYLKTIHPAEREMVKNAWLRCSALGQPMELDHRLKRLDGVYRWVHVRVDPLLDDRGRIVRWYGLLTDIDDQKRAEEALHQRERHLRLLVETIPALVSRSTAQGRLEYIDRRVVDYTGLEMEQIGLDVIHPDDQNTHVQKWRHALETGEPWDDTYRIRRADGEFRWFYDRVEPMRDQEGRVVCWYAVKIDIHDTREMEDMLRSTRRKLSAAAQIATVAELSASIAHEINQPLASVVTNAHACQTWLLHDPPNLERAQATLERIIRDGHSAAEVVRRIRALFREAPPVKVLLDINQIVAEVLRVLSDELRDNGIIVETDLEADLPMIEVDHVQIQQTLMNLVHNAIEAMHGVTDRTKSLVLGSRRQGEGLLIQVRDKGFGIEDATLIFEPFFTTKESGMGMGLSICRSIVEAHGGRVWATANEDAGMTFSFTLPLASDSPA
jgi:PAS domain S-box-containing protein